MTVSPQVQKQILLDVLSCIAWVPLCIREVQCMVLHRILVDFQGSASLGFPFVSARSKKWYFIGFWWTFRDHITRCCCVFSKTVAQMQDSIASRWPMVLYPHTGIAFFSSFYFSAHCFSLFAVSCEHWLVFLRTWRRMYGIVCASERPLQGNSCIVCDTLPLNHHLPPSI